MNKIRDVSIQNSENEEKYEDSSSEYILNSQAQNLHKSYQRLKQFLDRLTETKFDEFQAEIIAYSQKEHIIKKPAEEILKLCEKRIQKMLRNKKTKKNWNEDDINLLVWILNKYSSYHQKKSIHSFDQADWKFVSSLIPATTWKKCMFKWLSLKKFSLLTFRWSNEQSQLLTSLIKQHGRRDWKKLAQKLYVANTSSDKVFRTPKQCREHWNCYLNPLIKKGPWSIREDIRLLQNVLQLNCMKKWSQVAKNIKGRTQNAVKNRYTLLLQKQKKLTGQQSEKNLINRVLVRLLQEQTHQKTQIRSSQFQQNRPLNNIYQESQGSRISLEQKMKVQGIAQRKNIRVSDKNNEAEQKRETSVIIPTVVPNQIIYPQTHFYPFSPNMTPYFYHLMFGGSFPHMH